jgi:hypothetical protein
MRATSEFRRADLPRAFKKRRRLVPASSCYKWQRVTTKTFAGVYDVWNSGGKSAITNFAIVTTDAAPSLVQSHDRMPVVLEENQFEDWMRGPGCHPQIGNCGAPSIFRPGRFLKLVAQVSLCNRRYWWRDGCQVCLGRHIAPLGLAHRILTERPLVVLQMHDRAKCLFALILIGIAHVPIETGAIDPAGKAATRRGDWSSHGAV